MKRMRRREKVCEFRAWPMSYIHLLTRYAGLELVDEGGYDNWNEY